MRWLTISGSLKRVSSNGAALAAFAALAPAGVEVVAYEDLATLPPFNPDEDEEGATPPEAVAALRQAVLEADALILSAPEYAHGLPGAFKNALDWLVSSEAMVGKPVVLINTAPRAFHAQASLREILGTMAARLLPEAFATLPVSSRAASGESILADPNLAAHLRTAADALHDALV
jgi:NAD(P)H-dependent FMN reductase